ncbi:MAG: hypothetical protein JSS67_09300 [Bacteroidetes bacterium]|nr:hypothetical protein [Bacteroidota bacterium]
MFQYFFYTLLAELPIVILAYFHEWRKVIIVDILLNLFTWPLLTLLYFKTDIHLIILELGVFIVEAVGFQIYFKGTWKKAFFISFLANGLSLLLAVFLNGNSIFQK